MDLEGKLLPAVPVPFTADGQIDGNSQRAYVGWMDEQPAHGVAVWVHTGRGPHLSDQQRLEVLTAWRGGLSEGKLIVAGAGARSEAGTDPKAIRRDALEMANQAKNAGADAILVFPPTGLRGGDDIDALVLDYHRAMADSGLPLICFFLYEAAGGIDYGRDLLDRLFDLPGVVGIKMATLDSVVTYQDVASMISRDHPDITLITGEDRFLGYSIMCGARAALIGMGSACTAMQAELLSAYGRQDYDTFVRLSVQADELAMHTFIDPMEGYIQRMLWCLAYGGIIPWSATHDPWGPRLDDSERDSLRECLLRLGQPVSTTPPKGA